MSKEAKEELKEQLMGLAGAWLIILSAFAFLGLMILVANMLIKI